MLPEREDERARMVRLQLEARDITDVRVLEAMRRVPRERFVPPELARFAYEDEPLPIGFGQTISQPYMVALLCQEASVRPGHRVLDVGTGSGYQAAVLAELGAAVISIERIEGLAEQARRNLAAAGYGEAVEVLVGDGSVGVPERAPFDRILVAAAAPRPPEALLAQLVVGGRLVIPVGSRWEQWLEVVVATPEGPAVAKSVPCRFVPLVGAQGYRE